MAKCSMTRQHFQRIAEITGVQINWLHLTDDQACDLVDIAIDILRGTNDSFDSARFRTECFKQARLNGWLLDAEKALIQ